MLQRKCWGEIMRGLALEGGGAKGAYQAGAIKALNQRKIFLLLLLLFG